MDSLTTNGCFFPYILIKKNFFSIYPFLLGKLECVRSTATDGKPKYKPQPIRVHQESDLRFPCWNVTDFGRSLQPVRNI